MEKLKSLLSQSSRESKVALFKNQTKVGPSVCQYWQGDGPNGIPGLDASLCRCPACDGVYWVNEPATEAIKMLKKRMGSSYDIADQSNK